MDKQDTLEAQVLALTLKQRTGWELAEAYKHTYRSEIGFGVLLGVLKVLRKSGLVVAQAGTDECGEDVRSFRITGRGLEVLQALPAGDVSTLGLALE